MSQTPPTKLGKYQIIREIARSNDIVYEAYDPLMSRRVAVKELALPSGSTDQQKEDRVKRFLREARAAGSLAHPGIMTVYEVGEEAGKYFIAMEYLEGKTLRNELDTKGLLPPGEAIDIAKQVLEALSFAHSKGVIHRDIKPDNIQLLPDGEVKLTDFGIARLTFEPNLTVDGQVFGTPSYMSPEQVVGRDLDARSDLFSVGVTLYEMLAGSKPFAGDSVVTISYAIMNSRPQQPPQANYALWQVLEKALDKSPQLRHRDANEFIAALDAAVRASQSVVIDPTKGSPPVVVASSPSFTPAQSIYSYPNPSTPIILQPPGSGPAPTPPNLGGLPNVPLYYAPPAARKPWISKRAQAAIGQVLTIFVVVGSILGLSYVVMDQAARRITENAERKIQEVRAPATVLPASLADGQSLLANGKLDEAEDAFRSVIASDPNDPSGYRALSSVLEAQARRSENKLVRIDRRRQAAQNLGMALSLERDPALRSKDRKAAVASYVLLAAEFQKDDRTAEARSALTRATELAGTDPELRQMARQ